LWDLAHVDGIRQLRPGLSVILRDRLTRREIRIVAVHFKSMIGGAEPTSIIRFHQSKALSKALLQSDLPTLVMGDFNCDLTHPSDLEPLLRSGYELLGPDSTTPTQREGDRIDGYLSKGLGLQLAPSVIPVYLNAWEISDHAALMLPFAMNTNEERKAA
jgi:endonuclease/exonuclease/phosphatase family metal-dependent hydrolase